MACRQTMNAFRGMALLIVLLFPALSGGAEITFADVFNHHMVLQRDTSLPVWGTAAPDEQVTVRLEMHQVKTTADSQGNWLVQLPSMAAGGPFELSVTGNQTAVTLTDIMIGEVWLCSGQSNMEMAVQQTARGWDNPVDNARMEAAAAPEWDIRLLQLSRRISGIPRKNLSSGWTRSDSQSVASFSAVGYFFGRELSRELNVPVGLIDATWGGTRIEPWTPPEGFAAVTELAGISEQIEQANRAYRDSLHNTLPLFNRWIAQAEQTMAGGGIPGAMPAIPDHPLQDVREPTSLYNGMIAPLCPLSIRGVIWYQGEANRKDGMKYLPKMEALIRGWRSVWDQGTFPFYYVQLAPYAYGDEWEALPEIREAQRKALDIPNTGMVVTTDVGDLVDIHPRRKQTVGHRLALWALARTYNMEELIYSGPLFREAKLADSRVRVSFNFAENGLTTRDNQPLIWFELAGKNGIYQQAEAEIQGREVLVWHPALVEPDSIRYGWAETAQPYLMNEAGLPASPFRAAVKK